MPLNSSAPQQLTILLSATIDSAAITGLVDQQESGKFCTAANIIEELHHDLTTNTSFTDGDH
jgi:hypothetical protein